MGLFDIFKRKKYKKKKRNIVNTFTPKVSWMSMKRI